MIQGNLTPMIDMIFLLIVFFVLVSRIVDRERVEMNLPLPAHAATVRPGEEQRVIINVMPGIGGGIEGYRIGGTQFAADRAGLSAMTLYIATLFRTNPLINLNIRADRRTHYEHVEPALAAVSAAARTAGASATAARVNLVVVQDRPTSSDGSDR